MVDLYQINQSCVVQRCLMEISKTTDVRASLSGKTVAVSRLQVNNLDSGRQV